MRIATGSYTGDGSASRAITGIPFAPGLVWVFLPYVGITWRHKTMDANLSHVCHDSTRATDGILSLDAAGFTIGSNNEVNQNTTLYYYCAFEEDTTVWDYGSYTGDGGAAKSISCAYSTYTHHVQCGYDNIWYGQSPQVNQANRWFNTGGPQGLAITAYSAGGFEVGTTLNTSSTKYDWFAFTQKIAQSAGYTYTGDGTDNRDIIDSWQVEPDIILVTSLQNFTGNTGTLLWLREQNAGGDSTNLLRVGMPAIVPNAIQSSLTDGFQVGSDTVANYLTETYVYHMWQSSPIIYTSPPTIETPPLGAGGFYDFPSMTQYQRYKGLRQASTQYTQLLMGP